MIDVFAIVEGQTEETFVRELLYKHLLPSGVCIRPVLTGTRRTRRAHRGGHRGSYGAVRGDIHRLLREHAPRGCRVTTMLDMYGLPTDFPGFAGTDQVRDVYQRVAKIEGAMADDVGDYRFIPYIQLHEFESLLLAGPDSIGRYYRSRQAQIDQLATDVGAFEGPEWVNDGEATAPSKRIKRAVPQYDKVLGGSLIAMDIGLMRIIESCPHFADWVQKLKDLAEAPDGERQG